MFKEFEYHDIDKRGHMERLTYTSTDADGAVVRKTANVYLPFGYDTNDRKYNVFYLVHGGGGNEDAWLDSTPVKNVLDNMFSNGETEPFIVVFPTFYKHAPSEHRTEGVDRFWEQKQVYFFQKEIREDLLPAVEGYCRSFAEGTSPEALKASRMHRGIGGFSMGGVTTWYAFLNNLDFFSEFIPISGDCWAIEPLGGRMQPEATAKLLYEHIRNSGYSKEEFRIFVTNGTKDISFPALDAQLKAMQAYEDVFHCDEKLDQGNFHYLLKEDGLHAYQVTYAYFCTCVPYLFKTHNNESK